METNENVETEGAETTTATARVRVTAEELLTAAWEARAEGKGHEAIAEKLGIKKSAVASKLSALRNRKNPDGTDANINVPSFPRGGGVGSRLNVENLNSIAEKFADQVKQVEQAEAATKEVEAVS